MGTIKKIKADIVRLMKDVYQQGINDGKSGNVAFEDGFENDARRAVNVMLSVDGIDDERLDEICTAMQLIGKTAYCAFADVKKVIVRRISGFIVNPEIMLLADYGHGDSNKLCKLEAVGKTVFLTRPEAEAVLDKSEVTDK